MALPQLRSQIVSHVPYALNAVDRVTVFGRHHFFIASTSDEHVLRTERDDIEVRITHKEFANLLDRNDATIEYEYHAPAERNLRAVLMGRTEDDFTPQDIAYAKMKAALCDKGNAEFNKRTKGKRLFLNREFEEKELVLWTAELQKKKKGERLDTAFYFKAPSLTAYRDWLKRYANCGYRWQGLLPRHHGPGAFPVADDPDSYRVWKQFARGYISSKRPKVTDQFTAMTKHIEKVNSARAEQGLPPLVAPGMKRFRKMIANLNQFEVKAGREGLEAAKRYFHNIRQNYDVERPGQRVEMDSHIVDLKSFLVDTELWFQFSEEAKAEIEVSDTRIWFVSAVDAATRYCFALKAGLTQNSATATAALRMIMSDKTHLSDLVAAKTPWMGKVTPEEIVTDNGKEFLEGEFRQALLSCGIEHTTPAASEPARRPFIERFIGTFSQKLCVHFDGRTFSSVAERGDYNAEERTVLTVDELIKAAILIICDDYHNSPHESLAGNSPHNEFHDLCRRYPPHYPPSRKRLREVFGVQTKRLVHPYGVVYWGIPYNCDALQRARQQNPNQRVDVRVDRNSLRYISVRIDGDWHEVENEIGLDDSMSLAEWVYAGRDLAAKHESATLSGLRVMRDTVGRLREAGLAAQLRSDIEPDILDPIAFERLEDQVMAGTRFERPAMPIVILPDNPNDPLRGLQIGSGVPVTRAPKIPTAVEIAEHVQETAPSQFGDREEL